MAWLYVPGVGGIELGLRLALGGSYRTVGYVERDAFAAAALVARMEDEALDRPPIWDDLKAFDGRPWRRRVDIVTAGIPCQSASSAGRRWGLGDKRWLWPDVAAVLRDVDPRLVFLENVRGLLSVNAGAAFEEILGTLADLRFDAEWDVFSAGEFGAPHRRQRLFLLAYRHGQGRRVVGGSDIVHLSHTPRGHDPDRRGCAAVADARCGDVERRPVGGSLGDAARTGVGEGLQREWWRHAAGDGGSPLAGARARGLGVVGAPAEQGLDRLRHAEGSRAIVADATRSESVERWPVARQAGEGSSVSRPAGSGGHVVDAERSGGQGHGDAESMGWWPGPFPPGPGASQEWRAVLAVRPDLAPAVESAVRGVIDGLANKVDRLRASGNGVVPVVAATAFMALASRAGLLTEELAA